MTSKIVTRGPAQIYSLPILLPLVSHDDLDHLAESTVAGTAFGEVFGVAGFFGGEFSPALAIRYEVDVVTASR